jgi:hypothetical protein
MGADVARTAGDKDCWVHVVETESRSSNNCLRTVKVPPNKDSCSGSISAFPDGNAPPA